MHDGHPPAAASAPPEPPAEASPHPHALALAGELRAAFDQARTLRQAAGGAPSLHACLILERWQDTAIGQWLAEHLPELAAARVAVADPVYQGREDAAPCIVPLPEDWAQPEPTSAAACALRNMLPQWLEQAWRASRMRLRPLHFCGVAFTARDATSLAVHSAQLCFQHSPLDGVACFFRHFDPRVMQRAWPVLSVAQRRAWLGPVLAHWSVAQPWEPWSFEELVAEDALALAPRPRGWMATAPEAASEHAGATPDRQHLLDARQWQAALSAPLGNRAWAAWGRGAIAPAHQPGGQAMDDCIDLGARLGLSGADLEDFVAASWNLPDAQSQVAWATPWERSPHAEALRATLAQLRADAQLRFGSAWLQHRPPPHPSRSQRS